jgi:competence protein ComEC
MYWFLQRVHLTWQFTVGCMGVLMGVVLAQYAPFGVGLEWLFVGLLCWVVAAAAQRRWLLAFACIGGGLVGLWRGAIDQQAMTTYAPLYGKHVEIKGKITEDIDTNARGEAVVRLSANSMAGQPLSGDIWLTLPATAASSLRRSDTLYVDGRLDEGFGNYPASMSQASIRSVVREQPGDVALAVRDHFSEALGRAIHEPAASLGMGYLLGQKRGLPDDLATALQVAGLTHIVVASGYNLTILVRLGRRLFERVSKYVSMLVAAGLIGGFIAITGLSPSMMRAGLVAGLALWAWYYGRKFHPVTLLLFAASLTVLLNPSYAWGNIGWQLSFAAFGGVMIVAPLLGAYFFGQQRLPTVVQIFFETLSAQLATLPIILYVFGKFSAVAVLSNMLILPFVPLTMLCTFVAGVVALVVPGLASVAGMPAQLLLDAMIAVIKWFADITWAQIDWKLGLWAVVAWYVVITLGCFYLQKATKYQLRQASIVE